jgi:hypothetical protein
MKSVIKIQFWNFIQVFLKKKSILYGYVIYD